MNQSIMLNCSGRSRHQEVDTPFIPNSGSRNGYSHELLLPSAETEISPTSSSFSLPTVPQIRQPSPVVSTNRLSDYEIVPPRRCATKRRLQPEPEEDDEDEKSDEDEYRPSPALPPRKKLRTSNTPRARRSTTSRPAKVTPRTRASHSTLR